MNTTRFVAFAIAVLTAVLLSSTVQAQKGAFVSFKGIEISTGHEEPGEAYGWMCYARTTGALPGNFTMSIDYERVKAPGTSTKVSGGAWTLPVYASSKFSTARAMGLDPYQGVLFGSVVDGAITWDKAGTTATVELSLSIQGGTQTMAERRGMAVLNGTVRYDVKGTGTFDGTIYFEFQ